MTPQEARQQFWNLEAPRLLLEAQLAHPLTPLNKLPTLAQELSKIRESQAMYSELMEPSPTPSNPILIAELQEAQDRFEKLLASFDERLAALEPSEGPTPILARDPSPAFTVSRVQGGLETEE